MPPPAKIQSQTEIYMTTVLHAKKLKRLWSPFCLSVSHFDFRVIVDGCHAAPPLLHFCPNRHRQTNHAQTHKHGEHQDVLKKNKRKKNVYKFKPATSEDRALAHRCTSRRTAVERAAGEQHRVLLRFSLAWDDNWLLGRLCNDCHLCPLDGDRDTYPYVMLIYIMHETINENFM